MYSISIEGNIGSGKSYLLDYLKDKIDIDYYPEPVEKWTNMKGINLLENFYQQNKAFNLQTYIIITMAEIQKQKSSKIKVMERSLASGRNIFTEMSYRNRKLTFEEYNILISLYDLFDNKVDEIIYVKSDPDLCFSQLQKRGRSEETDIKIDYLKSLHELHEKWIQSLKDVKVTVINQESYDSDVANLVENLKIKNLFF